MISPRKTCLAISAVSISFLYVSYGLGPEETKAFTFNYPRLSAAIAAPLLIISVFAVIISFKFPALINDWSELKGTEYTARPIFRFVGFLLIIMVVVFTYIALVDAFRERL